MASGRRTIYISRVAEGLDTGTVRVEVVRVGAGAGVILGGASTELRRAGGTVVLKSEDY